jgi:choline dehydrogenase-like flavoprotein
MIYTHQHFTQNQNFDCDVLVIGTGAGGSSCLATLAEAGLNVIALENGDFLTPKDFNQREDSMFPKLFYDAGARRTKDKHIRVIHGKGVGGSTLHNINLCKPLPAGIIKKWGLADFNHERLAPFFKKTESDLQVSQLSETQMNQANQLFAKGVTNLGYRGGRLSHNRQGCKESGFCELGCSFNAKMNALRVYIPRAVKAGAKIFSNTRADKINYSKKRAYSCSAHVRNPENKIIATLTINFKLIVVSAGAIESPLLLLRSHTPDPYGLCGKRLHLHPGTAICGVFDQEINMWQGIPQSYECTEFLDLENDNHDKNLWLITGSAHPVGAASLMPSFGLEHSMALKKYPHLLAVTPMLHDSTVGAIRPRWGGGAHMDYQLNQSDKKMMSKGLYESAKILFAAGAKEVVIPNKYMHRLSRLSDWKPEFANISAGAIDMVSVHPMSSLWMGMEREKSCTTEHGRWHHVDNLYIADTSLFPTSIGVPPQISAYTMGHWVADAVLHDLKK